MLGTLESSSGSLETEVAYFLKIATHVNHIADQISSIFIALDCLLTAYNILISGGLYCLNNIEQF